MEKGKTKKKDGSFIIRDHYRSDGAKVRELMENEMYKRIINHLG